MVAISEPGLYDATKHTRQVCRSVKYCMHDDIEIHGERAEEKQGSWTMFSGGTTPKMGLGRFAPRKSLF